MAEPEKPFDPKATMQVDAVDLSEISDLESVAQEQIGHATPPPLPPPLPMQHSASAPAPPHASTPPNASTPPRRSAAPRPVDVAPSAGKRVLFAAMVAIMLAIAAVGGWFFATSVRGPAKAASVTVPSAAPLSPTAPAATATETATAGSPSAAPTFTLSPVEIH